MEKCAVVVLAAGLGKRLGGEKAKVLALAGGRPLIFHVLSSVAELSPDRVVVVTGHQRESVEKTILEGRAANEFSISDLRFAYQSEQKGTGHAVQCALSGLEGFSGEVLILCGDVPLLSASTLRDLLAEHRRTKATVSMLSFTAVPPGGYGRVLRGKNGEVVGVREAKDCSPQEKMITEVAAGVYAVESAFLAPAVNELTNNNAQGEYYLTDIVARAEKEGQTVAGLLTHDSNEVLGVNDYADLSAVEGVLRAKRIVAFQRSGVFIDDPSSVDIDPSVTIAPRARIGPNTQLRGKTSIGEGSHIEGTALLINTTVGANSLIKLGTRTEDAIIGDNVAVGPFAHLRPGTVLDTGVRIGNFVETKNARLHPGSKANHLTYLGDCVVGEETNIGAGTITCNYDGYNKHKTTIGKGVFVGSNSSLVAPVTIGDGAIVGAGSTITQDVSSEALALTRAPQTEKADWARRRRGAMESRKLRTS